MPNDIQTKFAGASPKFFTVQAAGGISTESPRQSIRDEQFSWLENIQPIADGNFRALYSNAAPLYTAPGTMVYHYPFNLDGTNYIFVCFDDGTALAVNADTGATATITTQPGAFYPSSTNLESPLPQAVQSGQNYLIIVSAATWGYAVWDGTLLYRAGTLSPVVTITNGGAGYVNSPTVQFFGGTGTGAIASASIANGAVTNINITNPGSGYTLGDQPTIALIGGQTTGSGASLTAVLSALPSGSSAVLTPVWHFSVYGPGSWIDQLISITVSNGGSGYSSFASAAFGHKDGGSWQGGAPTIKLTIAGGVITAATPVPATNNKNMYWNNNNDGVPAITVVDNGGGYYVSAVTITTGGTNYSPSTVIAVTSGGSPVAQASITPVITSGVITGTDIANAGQYGSNTPPTLTVTDTPVQATATIMLMPFGIQGTCVETYQSRAWVGNGPNIYFTAAGSIFDFDPGDGAGAFASNDPFLRREFTNLKQSGSFLYLFADSSINVISNIQESGSPTVVMFNNQNVDRQIGTPWHNSVIGIEDSLIFANIQGVFRLRGGNVAKISDDLDGIFADATATLKNVTSITQPTAALMQINKKLVYMLVLPIKGPFDVDPRTGLVMWDQKKWWVGSQDAVFTQVATQEIDSQIQAWGNTTTTLNKLFVMPSETLAKTWQTKLWAGEGPIITKQAMRLYTMAIDNTGGGYTFTGTYDYLLEAANLATQAFTITTSNLTGTGSINANIRGNYIGMTLSSSHPDFTVLAHALLYRDESPLGG